MHVSDECIELIKEFEGCYLSAYRDPVGVLTIGYGTTNADRAITGRAITAGMVIDEALAVRWLKASLAKKYEPLVMKYDSVYHWNQNEFDALVSFAYNIGSITQLTASGTRSRAEIAEKMLLYNKAGGKVLSGLTRRRQAERKLFLRPCLYSVDVMAREVIAGRWGNGEERKRLLTSHGYDYAAIQNRVNEILRGK